MKFMIIVKATPDSEAGRFPPDSEKLFAAMADYHEQLATAGGSKPMGCNRARRAGASNIRETSAP